MADADAMPRRQQRPELKTGPEAARFQDQPKGQNNLPSKLDDGNRAAGRYYSIEDHRRRAPVRGDRDTMASRTADIRNGLEQDSCSDDWPESPGYFDKMSA